MVFYAAFNIISVISRQQVTLFISLLVFASTTLGLWECLFQEHSRKNQQDPVWIKPKTSRLQFNYSTTPYLSTTQLRLLMTLYKKLSENIVGKEENVGEQHFLLFPQRFLPFSKQILIFQSCLFCRL